ERYRRLREALPLGGNAAHIAAQDRARGPLPEELHDPLSGNPIASADFSAGPAMHKIEQHDSPLDIRSMQMHKDRYLRWERKTMASDTDANRPYAPDLLFARGLIETGSYCSRRVCHLLTRFQHIAGIRSVSN